MFDLMTNWLDLFRRDRLLADKSQFYRGLAIGVAVTAALFVVITLLSGNLWIGAAIAGLAGGALQPYLFRNLRYR